MVDMAPQVEKARSEPPQTLSRFFTAISGTSSTAAEEKYAARRAEAERFNAQLKTGGCTTVEIDSEVARLRAIKPAKAVVSVSLPGPPKAH